MAALSKTVPVETGGAALAALRRRAVILAAIAQNCALGLTFGSIGPLLPAFQSEFGASRGQASLAAGLFVLTMSLASPGIGRLLTRVPVRAIMMAGAALSALGYALLIFANDIGSVLLVYGVVLGPAACMLGVLPASTHVSQWVDEGRGKALGLVNMPILLCIMPPVSALILTRYGMDTLFVVIACLFFLCMVATSRVIDRPKDDGRTDSAGNIPETLLSTRQILAQPDFWRLSIGVGIIAGGGTMITAHLVPLAGDREIPVMTASWLLSAYAGAGLAGALLFGWLADRLGSSVALVIAALVQAIAWVLLIFPFGFGALLALAIVIGMGGTGILALHAAAIGEIFGRANVAAVFGASYLPKLLFIFGAPPLAGILHDLTGSYRAALLLHVIMFFIALAGFLLLPRRGHVRTMPPKTHSRRN